MASTKKTNFPRVEVTWLDSMSSSGWMVTPDTEPLRCWSVGFLVGRSKRSAVVALNCVSERSSNSFGDTMTIPAGCIISIRRLQEASAARKPKLPKVPKGRTPTKSPRGSRPGRRGGY